MSGVALLTLMILACDAECPLYNLLNAATVQVMKQQHTSIAPAAQVESHGINPVVSSFEN